MSMNRIQRAINRSARLHVMVEHIQATGDSPSADLRRRLDEGLTDISKEVTAQLNKDIEAIRKAVAQGEQ